MGTSVRQDNDFYHAMADATLLGRALDWIGGNLSPEDVFSDDDLSAWAKDNGWSLGE